MKKKNLYFAEKEEQAVLDYISSNSATKKNKIYNTILIEPFRKMIQSILRRYPVHIGNYTMEEVEAYALTHLIEHMVKYKPFIIERKEIDNEKWIKLNNKYRFFELDIANETLEKLKNKDIFVNEKDKNKEFEYRIFNSKAYSYCQTIVRNYFKDHTRKSYNDKKTNLFYDDYIEEINQNIEYHYELNSGNEHHVLELLINNVVEKINDILDNSNKLKNNEIIVGEAISNVLTNWHELFLEDSPDGKYNKKVTNKFAKNKILFFLKEQTGLSTKEIRMAMKPFKDIYYLEKQNFIDD